MKQRRSVLIFSIALMLTILACNINSGSTSSSPQSQSAIASIVAATLQAVQSASSAPLNTPTSLPSPTATPLAVIKTVTYCRTGPGENFKSILDLNAKQQAAILGKNSSGSYWLIQTASGPCWVDAKYVSITGDTQNIPEATSPPSTTGVPERPSHLNASANCNPTTTTNVLTWTDNADNEKGYNVLRFGNMIASLPPNSTTFTDTVTIAPGTKITYSVEAYNDAGASAPVTAISVCQ